MMKRIVAIALVALVGLCLVDVGWSAQGDALAQITLPKRPIKRPTARIELPQKPGLKARPGLQPRPGVQLVPGALALLLSDLTVSVTGPERAVAGDTVTIEVTARNGRNRATAKGSNDGPPPFYVVDLVLSSDTDIPMAYAVWPGYAGKTADDFLEDMLLRNGRISGTDTLGPGAAVTYTVPVPIPKDTPHGVYYIGAVVDPAKRVPEINERNNTAYYKINIAPPDLGPVAPVGGLWIMPYAVGDTPLNKIGGAGRTTYADSLSGLVMSAAPFGSRLGFRHGYQSSIPTEDIKYYRWLYRSFSETGWHEFTEAVGVHYTREKGGKVSFPVYPLGPKAVAGKTLYEFRPHDPPVETGATTSWPAVNWFGDIYSGFLNSPALPDGQYKIKLEIYNASGGLVAPGPGSFKFIVPKTVAPDGAVTTRNAKPGEKHAGGFIFSLAIDNRKCGAVIDAPAIGTTTVADQCGFLLYGSKMTDEVTIAYHATHPDNAAMFTFTLTRGAEGVGAAAAAGEVAALSAGPYGGDGVGNFTEDFGIPQLLGPKCPTKAAFAENLHVYAKATTGWRHRINRYDARAVRAFALAPK